MSGVRAYTPGMKRNFSMRVASVLQRTLIARFLGQANNGKRDYYESFGWPHSVTSDMIWGRYERGGIAKRIAHAFPDGCWGRPPQVYVRDNHEWNVAWDKFVADNDLWTKLHKLDVMSQLGRYAVLVVGRANGSLDNSRPDNVGVSFLRPYPEVAAQIGEWVNDANSERFGNPLSYNLTFSVENTTYSLVSGNATQGRALPMAQDGKNLLEGPLAPKGSKVHFSNVLHVATDTLENDIFGRPIFLSVWNYLLDLDKIIGSSSESYWLTSFPGLHANVDKELELADDDEVALTDEVDEYMNGFRRFIRTRGVSVKAIDSRTADPKSAFSVLITLIAAATGIPQRILMGAEAGQLASTQDKANWAERLIERRSLHCEPNILRPLLKYLIEHGIIADPGAPIQILWPEAFQQSPLERGMTAAQTARTMMNIVSAVKDAPELISQEEARMIIGLSTDQGVMEATPTGTNSGVDSINQPPKRTLIKIREAPAKTAPASAGGADTPGTQSVDNPAQQVPPT